MKLLFDQNISFRILRKLIDEFPNSQQVKRLGLDNTADIKIWEYAKSSGFTIVTFDADFLDIAALYGHPPKIIWLRTGNTTTENIAQILKSKKNIIEEFLYEEENMGIACLEIE